MNYMWRRQRSNNNGQAQHWDYEVVLNGKCQIGDGNLHNSIFKLLAALMFR